MTLYALGDTHPQVHPTAYVHPAAVEDNTMIHPRGRGADRLGIHRARGAQTNRDLAQRYRDELRPL